MNDYLKGARSVSPILAGLIPFGLIYGAGAVTSGMTKTSSVAMSLIIFAGAAQISVVHSFASGTTVPAAVATAALINLRMVMYSASIAEHIRSRNIFIRIFSSFLLTDQAYAVTITEGIRNSETDPLKFYTGAALLIWLTWQVSTLAGVIMGKTLPVWLSIEFAVPLTFLALLGPFLKNRYFMVAALVSGICMILTRNIPYNGGFFIAVFSGIAAGFVIKKKGREK